MTFCKIFFKKICRSLPISAGVDVNVNDVLNIFLINSEFPSGTKSRTIGNLTSKTDTRIETPPKTAKNRLGFALRPTLASLRAKNGPKWAKFEVFGELAKNGVINFAHFHTHYRPWGDTSIRFFSAPTRASTLRNRQKTIFTIFVFLPISRKIKFRKKYFDH